jgi:hypothetical protein
MYPFRNHIKSTNLKNSQNLQNHLLLLYSIIFFIGGRLLRSKVVCCCWVQNIYILSRDGLWDPIHNHPLSYTLPNQTNDGLHESLVSCDIMCSKLMGCNMVSMGGGVYVPADAWYSGPGLPESASSWENDNQLWNNLVWLLGSEEIEMNFFFSINRKNIPPPTSPNK